MKPSQKKAINLEHPNYRGGMRVVVKMTDLRDRKLTSDLERDSTFAGSVTRWQMETEELYLRPEEEYVPEEARVTILGVKITLEEHMAEVRYRQGPQGATSPSTSTTTSSIGSGGVSRASTMMGEKRIYNNNERQAIVRW